MALSVAPLAGFPAVNSALSNPTTGSPVDSAAFSFTNNVYTQSGTQYVAGLLDVPGGQPPRIFPCQNGSVPLPTLVSVTLNVDTGGSIQEFGATTTQTNVPGTFVVLLTPATGQLDDGVFPLGYSGPVAWTLQGGAYSNANAATGYPQPQQRFVVSFSAMLILASTQYG